MSAKTLVDHFRAKAAEDSGRLAYTYPADAADAERLTRGELDRRARRVAALLEREGLAGERVLLLYPPGLDFVAAFLGCLYGGAVAVPAYPPGSKRALPKIAAIVGDARPAVTLTTSAQRSRLEKLTGEDPDLGGLRWLTTDDADEGLEDRWSPPRLEPESLAFLQYTSGSTAAPKGVMVSHGNLLHNEEMIRDGFGQSEASVIVGWLPLYHDMGLIGNVLQPLYLGAECHLMSPISFLRRPLAWLRAIDRHRASTSGGPNFAYDLCVQKVRDEDLPGLDLSSWRVAFNGSEPVRAETLDRFAERFSACGFRRSSFYPCYGLAEATLFVTGPDVEQVPRTGRFNAAALEEHRVTAASDNDAARELVSSGRTWRDQEVAIVDPETLRRAGDGAVGEIWIAGGSVARGYWHQPEKTAQDFGARPADEPDAGPFLRTGDLGFVADGELFVTGRHKDLIILRGRNHYPQDLEGTAEKAHPALRPGAGAAFSVDADGEERLILVWELERGARADAAEVAAAVRQEVSQEHEVQVREVVLLRPGSIPKTTSGKIRRHACRADYLAERLTVVDRHGLQSAAPEEEEVDPTLAALGLRRAVLLVLRDDERLPALLLALRLAVAETAGIPISRVSPEEPVAGFGLDAAKADVLAERIEKGLGVRPRPESLLVSSVDGLAREFLAGLEPA